MPGDAQCERQPAWCRVPWAYMPCRGWYVEGDNSLLDEAAQHARKQDSHADRPAQLPTTGPRSPRRSTPEHPLKHGGKPVTQTKPELLKVVVARKVHLLQSVLCYWFRCFLVSSECSVRITEKWGQERAEGGENGRREIILAAFSETALPLAS